MNNKKGITITFWGVRGSIPSPLTPAKVEEKIIKIANHALNCKHMHGKEDPEIREWLKQFPRSLTSTYGGNTTCVEVRCGDQIIILDMGSGLRELGNALMPEMIAKKGLTGTILQSHMHWDHIQGYPFWKQVYMPNNTFDFYGGKEWDKTLQEVLRSQMDPPKFPVSHREIECTGLKMHFCSVHDGKKVTLNTSDGPIDILCHKLNHPQETYGYRIEFNGQAIAFCTDHEPYPAMDKKLITLAKNADVFITDCQYTWDEYSGVHGIQKTGWGHSYPEYIAQAVLEAKPKLVIATHHDPESNDERIEQIAQEVERLGGIKTLPAYEGLVIPVHEISIASTG